MASTYHQTGRFYQAEYPGVEECVVVRVKKIDDKIGAYVELLEYGNKEGFITLSEISKRRIRSMLKELRVGTNEVMLVVSVDEEKGYINLSKKRVASEDVAPQNEKFAKAKNIHGIMQHVAQINQLEIDDLCAKVSWPLNLKYSTAFDVFKKHVNGEMDVWKVVDFSQPDKDLSSIQDKLKADIETVLQRRLLAAQVRLQAKVEVSCFGYEGIDAVKEALLEGLKASRDEIKVNIKLIAHPLFALTCICSDKEVGIKVLEESMEMVEKAIKGRDGAFNMKTKPTFIATDKDDLEAKSDDESGSSSDEDQDETMGKLDEADFARLKAKAAAAGGDSD